MLITISLKRQQVSQDSRHLYLASRTPEYFGRRLIVFLHGIIDKLARDKVSVP